MKKKRKGTLPNCKYPVLSDAELQRAADLTGNIFDLFSTLVENKAFEINTESFQKTIFYWLALYSKGIVLEENDIIGIWTDTDPGNLEKH